MCVYVGKDVTVTIQSPVEEDLGEQANGTNTVFTVSKKPISDRDQDGVADEPAHVTAYVDGSEATVSAVDDDQGTVTLASAPSPGARVVIEYRYDSTPEVAQEISIEPKQAIEGIHGLGDNKIQVWASLLKEYAGSLKELFRSTDQFNRLTKKWLKSKYSRHFWYATELTEFEGDTANFAIDTVAHELYVLNDNLSIIGVKNTSLPIFRDGIIKCKTKIMKQGDDGWVFRWDGTAYNYYRVVFQGDRSLRITRVKNLVETHLFTSEAGVIPSETWKGVEIKFKENKITVDVEGKIYSVVDSDPLLIEGRPGFYAYYAMNDRYDDFQVWSEISPDEYGLILNYTRGASTVKIALDGVVFPEGSIPSPKNAPVFITSRFRARKIKFIT